MIILTRSEPGAAKTASYLMSNGIADIHTFPLLDMQPRKNLPSDDGGTDIIFTSANAVRALSQGELKPRNQNVWCVGSATAAVADDYGWKNIRHSTGDAAALAGFIIHNTPRNYLGRFLHYANRAASNVIPQRLTGAGFNIVQITAYDMHPNPVTVSRLVALANANANAAKLVFHSAAAARVFTDKIISQLDAPRLQKLQPIAYAPQVAIPLSPYINDVTILPRSNDKSLLATLANT